VKVALKGINTVKKRLSTGGVAVYYYHRATGAKLSGRPGTEEFLRSFGVAEKAMCDRGQGDLNELVTLFETSGYFDDLSPATREAYIWKLKKIRARWGTCPIVGVQEPDFRADALEWHETLGKSSRRSADNLLSALARVLSYAKEKSKIKVNVLDTFTRLYKSNRADKVWTDDQIAKFVRKARPSMVTAMFIAKNTGLRQKDIRELPWSAYDGTEITLRTSKTGAAIKTPCPLELKNHLDGLTRSGVLMLTTVTGRAYKKRHFNDCWREDCDLAEIEELNFHDVRGTAATALAEAGATVPMIASIMGWSHQTAQKVIDSYVARNSNLAKAGIELLEKHRQRKAKSNSARTKSANRLQTGQE